MPRPRRTSISSTSAAFTAVSAALTRRDRAAAGIAAGAALKLTVLAALPAGVGLSVLARPILQLLYPAVPETAEAAAYHLTFWVWPVCSYA